jgi:arylsulfatase A-like enzyme
MRPALAGSCLLLAALAGCGGGDDGPDARNLVLISLDSTRRDMVGPYGRDPLHARGEPLTPHIDRLAAEGVVFERAYATTSWTMASHMSILTGQPELVHAVDVDYHRLDPARPMLAEELRASGFRTAGFVSAPYLEPEFGFDRGFERFEATYGGELGAAAAAAREAKARYDAIDVRRDPAGHRAAWDAHRRAQARMETLSHRDVSSEIVADRAVAELREAAADGRRFFVFAHFFDPHYDYVPPAPWDERFDPGYEGTLTG